MYRAFFTAAHGILPFCIARDDESCKTDEISKCKVCFVSGSRESSVKREGRADVKFRNFRRKSRRILVSVCLRSISENKVTPTCPASTSTAPRPRPRQLPSQLQLLEKKLSKIKYDKAIILWQNFFPLVLSHNTILGCTDFATAVFSHLRR